MRDSARLEALSDGVMAIAITLLVLDLRVPARDTLADHDLAGALGRQCPSYLAYLVIFLDNGIIWTNHHAMFALVRQVDRGVLFANLLLLFVVSVIPFPTRLLAEYLTAPGSASHVAAAVYSATMLLMSFAFSGLWLAVTRDARLTHAGLSRAESAAALRRFGAGSIVYAATVGLSFVSAVATLAVHGAIALYYCFDQISGRISSPAA
jgi:uncharacterized membrane protein